MPHISVEAGTSAHDVLRLLYEKGPLRQSQIAELLNVSVAASNRQFKKLIEENLIIPCANPTSSGGRPSQSWRINNDGNCFLGIIFYDGSLSAMLLDFEGQALWHKSQAISPKDGQKELLGKLLKITELATALTGQNNWRILQCFIGVQGLMSQDGTILNVVNLPALNGLQLEQELESRFGFKCFCDATHHAQVLSETSNLSPESTALIINWSDGFGGMVVSNRQLLSWPAVYPRRRRGIWDMGHIRIKADGRPCHCGNRGCLEAYVGGRALREQHPELNCKNDKEMLRKALDGDIAVQKTLCNAARLIAETQYWLIELFGVDTIIFTGAYSGAFGIYENAFRDGLRVLHTPEELLEISLTVNNDPYRNFCWGAALMARQFYFYPDESLALRGLGRLSTFPVSQNSEFNLAQR